MGETETVEGEELALTVGDRLRAAREEAGLSLEDVATTTRIPTRHLQSLEASDFARLPAPTYTVGFAKNYAAAVGLDREEIGERLRGELGGTRPATATPDLFEPADPARAMPRWLILGAIAAVVLAALIFTWLNNRSLEAPDEVALENLAAPVETAPAAPAPAPAQGQQPVALTANEPVWLQVYERGGAVLYQGELAAGQSYTVPANAIAPLLKTGKPEALRISVGTADAPAIGPAGTTVSDVSLLPADLLRARPTATTGAPAEPRAAPSQTASRRRTPARTSPPAESATAPADSPADSTSTGTTPQQ